VGCQLDIRVVGVIAARQTEDGKTERNDRLLGVAIHSYQHEHVTSIDNLSKTLLSQVEEFFISYNRQRGKKFKVTGTSGPRKAIKVLKAGMRAHKQGSASSERTSNAP
jgi:inorganic pyrophosphatase